MMLSIFVSFMSFSVASVSIAFDLDTSPSRRVVNPEVFGYIKDAAARASTFKASIHLLPRFGQGIRVCSAIELLQDYVLGSYGWQRIRLRLN